MWLGDSRWGSESAGFGETPRGWRCGRPRIGSGLPLRNLAVLVNAVAFFTAVVLGTGIRLDILATHLPSAAKRLFGIRLHALADGIREVCARSPRRSHLATNATPQLTLGFR